MHFVVVARQRIINESNFNFSEWLINQHRDSYASYIGHHHMIEFFAIAENETKARVKFNFIQKMLQPCGPPPEKPKDDDDD
jgi:splicing factor 3B subunit 5